MYDILEGSSNFGKDIKWWIGIVAPRSAWASGGLLINDNKFGKEENKGDIDIYYNRVKVKVVGYHDQVKDPNDLPWANILASPMMASGYGFKDKTHQLEGGESVFGFWMDGEDEQKPCIIGVFYHHKKPLNPGPQTLSGSAPSGFPRIGVLSSLDKTETGQTAGTSVATNQPIPEQRYSNNFKFDSVTGRITSDVDYSPYETNEGTRPESVGDSVAAHHTFLNRKTSRPTCKRDNAIGQITGLLGDFAEYLLTLQNYANFYVNSVLGVITDLEAEISLIAKQITGIMTGLFNAVRDAIFTLVGDKISQFVNSVLPEEIKPIFGESLKGIMDTIYCIFENLIAALFKTIVDFLGALVGNFINAPICAAEQLVGALLSNLFNQLQDAIAPILDSISESIGGALGTVNDIINQALEIIGIVYSFIGCDKFKCPMPSRYDNAYGPTQQQRDNARKIFDNISILNIPTSVTKTEDGYVVNQDIGGFLGEVNASVESIFGQPSNEGQRTAEYIASLVGVCDTKILRCGPPTVQIFGGDGVGGAANAVVNNLGQIIGVDLVERGIGYSKESPPYVTFSDACGDGKGARGRVIILDTGEIGNIVIDYPGYGYNNNFPETITTYGTIPGDTSDNTSTGSSNGSTVTGQIDNVIVNNTGIGYNPDDTVLVNGIPVSSGTGADGTGADGTGADGTGADGTGDGSPIIDPVIIGGQVVDIKVIDPGTGFTEIPEITINSDTGIGADLSAVLKFINIEELSRPLDPTKVVQVINCVSK